MISQTALPQESVPSFQEASGGVLKKHAKSFHWASWFLPEERLARVQELYHFCRYADDVADCLNPADAQDRLQALEGAIVGASDTLKDITASSMLERLRASGVEGAWMRELVVGVRSDLEPVRVRDQGELLRYCYRVAGVVGLMMCPLIGVLDRRAYPFAIDLGIAMQLTNIARDVAEDARRGRVYLPDVWLREVGASSEGLLGGYLSERQVQGVVDRCLRLADIYYESGRSGLLFIPWQPRLAIAVAARLYQAIGGRLRRRLALNPWRGRAYVGKLGKLALTLRELAQQAVLALMGRANVKHKTWLHHELKGLPEVTA